MIIFIKYLKYTIVNINKQSILHTTRFGIDVAIEYWDYFNFVILFNEVNITNNIIHIVKNMKMELLIQIMMAKYL